jgi:hypothetical protein
MCIVFVPSSRSISRTVRARQFCVCIVTFTAIGPMECDRLLWTAAGEPKNVTVCRPLNRTAWKLYSRPLQCTRPTRVSCAHRQLLYMSSETENLNGREQSISQNRILAKHSYYDKNICRPFLFLSTLFPMQRPADPLPLPCFELDHCAKSANVTRSMVSNRENQQEEDRQQCVRMIK